MGAAATAGKCFLIFICTNGGKGHSEEDIISVVLLLIDGAAATALRKVLPALRETLLAVALGLYLGQATAILGTVVWKLTPQFKLRALSKSADKTFTGASFHYSIGPSLVN
ncbi:hypothetical protein NC651_007560 [Populus alba x Populus x berolinensis]|nr:hypothetical protein NC651_007560 [Populus alba x Populus x berolinensis]